jgi:hypothetical protein
MPDAVWLATGAQMINYFKAALRFQYNRLGR